MARAFIPQIATGNDLLLGDVVYLTALDSWSREHCEAEPALDEAAAKNLLLRASRFPNQVVGVYLADASLTPSGPQPIHFREVFRTRGPSNHLSHGKQSGA